jgi:competence protein ComEC
MRFLFSNFIAVPLSGLILYLEIILLVVAPLPILAVMIGKCTSFLLLLMNRVIENTATIPFAVTEHIQINLFQTICLFGVIVFFSVGLMNKKRKICNCKSLALYPQILHST